MTLLDIQEKCQTIVIYIDFSKAFDVVQQDKLVIKLHAYGSRGVLLQWIKTFSLVEPFALRLTFCYLPLLSWSVLCYRTTHVSHIY